MVVFLFINSSSICQVSGDLDFIIRYNAILKSKLKTPTNFVINETSETKMLCIGMIRFYQVFISSQQNDQSVCTFTPSCSQFGLLAIQKYGSFYGILMTSDRILRCHGFSSQYYSRDIYSGKLYDSIEPYFGRLKFK